MSTELISVCAPPPRVAWSKGRSVGQKQRLQPKHVWAVRIWLGMSGDSRDLALFNMAIDRKQRGGDLVRLQMRGRASVIQ